MPLPFAVAGTGVDVISSARLDSECPSVFTVALLSPTVVVVESVLPANTLASVAAAVLEGETNKNVASDITSSVDTRSDVLALLLVGLSTGSEVVKVAAAVVVISTEDARNGADVMFVHTKSSVDVALSLLHSAANDATELVALFPPADTDKIVEAGSDGANGGDGEVVSVVTKLLVDASSAVLFNIPLVVVELTCAAT